MERTRLFVGRTRLGPLRFWKSGMYGGCSCSLDKILYFERLDCEVVL